MVNKITGISGRYIKAFDIAGQVIIDALVDKGYETIILDHLYDTLGVDTKAGRVSVQWAVRRAKDAGIIAKTKVRGVYQVIK